MKLKYATVKEEVDHNVAKYASDRDAAKVLSLIFRRIHRPIEDLIDRPIKISIWRYTYNVASTV